MKLKNHAYAHAEWNIFCNHSPQSHENKILNDLLK